MRGRTTLFWVSTCVVLIVFFNAGMVLAQPTVEIFARGSEMTYWHKVDFLTSGENSGTQERADDISFVINSMYQYRVDVKWEFKENLGNHTELYYFDSLPKVLIFIRMLNQHMTGSYFKR